MSLLLGLCLSLGLLCIWWSFWPRTEQSAPRARRPGKVQRLLAEAGHPRLGAPAVFAATFFCALTAFLAVVLLTQAVPVALCFTLFASALPWAALNWQAARRRAVLRELWPDAVDHLRSAVRAGMSLSEALAQLGQSGPEPLREPFAEFGRDYRSGQTMELALIRLRERLADPVGDRIVVALNIAREVGGSDVGRLLSTLAEYLRENARTRSELEARQSWTRNAAKLAVAAPWIVVLLLSTQPEAAEAYRGMTGLGVLGGGLAVSALCYRVMIRLGALPAEERVFA